MSDLFGNPEPAMPPVASDLLRAYDIAYRQHYHVPAPIVGSKDGALAARLLRRYAFNDLYDWLGLFFLMPDPFIRQNGHSFGVFSLCLSRVIAFAHRRRVAHIERQPITQNLLDIRQRMLEEEAVMGQEFAEQWYRERPWLSR